MAGPLRISGLFLITCSFCLLIGCDEPVAAPLPVAVRVEPLAQRVFRNETPYSATVKERQRVELSFKVPGTVKELFQVRTADGKIRDVQEGDRLPKGTVIARLDDVDYRRDREMARERLGQARAKLDSARAGSANASRDFDRAQRLSQRSMIPPQELDAAEAKARAFRADLAAAEREVASAELSLSKAEDDLANCALAVPIDGAVVALKLVEPFERVAAAKSVFVVLDTRVLKAAFGMPDTQLSQVKLGQEVPVEAEALQGQQFPGKVTKVAPAADEQTRTFLVEVSVEAPGPLRPGMIVTTRIGERRAALSLPLSAVMKGDRAGEFRVYQVLERDGETVAETRSVTLAGLADDRVILVPGNGTTLSEGARVVVDGVERLHEGQKVRVLDGPTELAAGVCPEPIR